MPAPSSQDLIAGFDPTGQVTITAVQLLALVQSATPYSDKGMVIVTTDNAGVPSVPDARTGMGNDKWQKYVWARVQDTTASLYMWSPGSALDATFLNWISVAISIPAGSITGDDIADNTIPATKIISVDWSQLTGVPSGGIPPGGPAGGSLSGNYPNPGIADLAVATSKLAAEAVTNAKLSGTSVGTPAVDLAKNIIVSGVWPAFGMLRVNAGATGLEAVAKLITTLAEPTIAEAFKVPRVNSLGTAFEYAGGEGLILQTVTATSAVQDSTATAIPCDTSIPQITEGKEYLTISITPKSATSKLRIVCTAMLGIDLANSKAVLALFQDAGADALQAVSVAPPSATACEIATIDFIKVSGSTAAKTFRIRFGGDTGRTGYINQSSTIALFGASANVTLTVQEIL